MGSLTSVQTHAQRASLSYPKWAKLSQPAHNQSAFVPRIERLLGRGKADDKTGAPKRTSLRVAPTKTANPWDVALGEAWMFPFMQPNWRGQGGGVWIVSFDLDESEAVRRLSWPTIPRPDYVIETRPGRLQAGYVLAKPVMHGPKSGPIFERLAQFEMCMKLALRADLHARTRSKMRNPWYGFAQVWWNQRAGSRTLSDLVNHLEKSGLWQQFGPDSDAFLKAQPKKKNTIFTSTATVKTSFTALEPETKWREGERNDQIFEYTRWPAYKGADPYAIAHELNRKHCVPMLPDHEVDKIADSITEWIAEYYVAGSGASPVSAARRHAAKVAGAIGGGMNTSEQQKARAKGPKAAAQKRTTGADARAVWAQSLAAEGMTRAQIAGEMKCSERTVARLLKRNSGGVTSLDLSGGTSLREGTHPHQQTPPSAPPTSPPATKKAASQSAGDSITNSLFTPMQSPMQSPMQTPVQSPFRDMGVCMGVAGVSQQGLKYEKSAPRRNAGDASNKSRFTPAQAPAQTPAQAPIRVAGVSAGVAGVSQQGLRYEKSAPRCNTGDAT